MSLNDAVNYEFDYDKVPMMNEYVALGTDYVTVNDGNSFNYLNNWINFNSNSLQGRDTEKILNFSNGYLRIPYTTYLLANKCQFGDCTNLDSVNANGDHLRIMATLEENAYAVGVKNFLHFIDNYTLKWNGVQVNTSGNPLCSLLMQEKLKKMNRDEYALYSEIISHAWDSHESYIMNPTTATNTPYNGTKNTGLEINNGTVQSDATLTGFDPKKYANQGHVKRMNMLNNDINSTDFLLKKMYAADKIGNSQACVFKGVYGSNGQAPTPGDNKVLMFTGIASIPLALFSDFFAKLGSVASANFELKLQTNIGSNNQWTYNFSFAGANPTIGTAIKNNILLSQSVDAVQSIGNICPFICSPPAYKSDTGLSVYPDYNVTACSVTISSKIGYDVPYGSVANSGIPCTIIVPVVNINPVLSAQILEMKEPQRVLYDDYTIEWLENISYNAQIRKTFQNQLNRPRKMLIFPFLSKSLACKVPVYQQCTSSAPNTVSPVRLMNFQIKRGSQNMFTDKQQYNWQFYNSHYLPLECANGASLKSTFFSGQITKTMWERCYGVYEFDITGALDEVQDNLPKSFGLDFDVDSVAGLAYDFLVVFVTQSELAVSRATGLVNAPSQN
jgi:hypothetical protein